ncbi:DUF5961 family protein [Caulobacter sp. DWR1-3-2b1]|uniref:DUF5961 family protein n=1 Tax=Caulobacter sp. DWR1-3-2b1 TaxID=2804670 RepID=UPI003CEF9651
MASPVRAFRVRGRHADGHHARLVNEASFEAAAIAYIEDVHPVTDDGDTVGVIVRDIESGHEHCFWIDLDTGETAPCD